MTVAFCMKDSRWGNLGIGHPMKEFGCLITAIAIIAGKAPDRILAALNSHVNEHGLSDCFDSTGQVIWKQAVKALGLKSFEVLPEGTAIEKYPIIAVTDHFAPAGYPQHFFCLLSAAGDIIDPLDGQKKNLKLMPHPYAIRGYRLLS